MELIKVYGNEELTLLGAIELYLSHIGRKGLRKATINNAKVRLSIIANWLLAKYPDLKPSTTTVHHLRAYQDDRIAEARVMKSTINTDISMMHRLFTWLYEEHLIQHNPSDGLHKVKDDKRQTEPYTDEEIGKLLAVTQPKKTHAQARNHLMQLLLLDTGLRCNEMLSVKFKDIDFLPTGGKISVPADAAKNRLSRDVPFSRTVADEIRDYMKLRNKLKEITEEDYVFCSQEAEKMTDRAVQQIFQQIGNASGVRKIKRVSAHSYRATFAVSCLRNGMQVFALMQLGGWQSVEALAPYVRLAGDDLINAHATASPVERLKNKKDASNNPLIRMKKKRLR